MKSRITRTSIATLAILSALALSAGPASAAVTPEAASGAVQAQLAPTPAECSSIRQEISFLVSMRALAQSELQWATPSQKADLVREIKSLTAQIKVLSEQLVGCPPA